MARTPRSRRVTGKKKTVQRGLGSRQQMVAAIKAASRQTNAARRSTGGGWGGPLTAGDTQPVFTGAIMRLDSTQFAYSSSANVAFDESLVDTDGFWDEGTSKFVIPSGLDGMYRVSLYLSANFDADTQSSPNAAITTSGDPDNLSMTIAPNLGAGLDALACTIYGLMLPLVEGDDIAARLAWTGGGTVDIFRGQFVVEYLGAAPA